MVVFLKICHWHVVRIQLLVDFWKPSLHLLQITSITENIASVNKPVVFGDSLFKGVHAYVLVLVSWRLNYAGFLENLWKIFVKYFWVGWVIFNIERNVFFLRWKDTADFTRNFFFTYHIPRNYRVRNLEAIRNNFRFFDRLYDSFRGLWSGHLCVVVGRRPSTNRYFISLWFWMFWTSINGLF